MPVLERLKFPLNIENLPSGLTAVATPQKITVKVGKKVKRDGMLLSHKLTKARLIPLQIDSITVSNERVSVTTDQETLAKIDKVIALLPTSERITGKQWFSTLQGNRSQWCCLTQATSLKRRTKTDYFSAFCEKSR